MAFETLSTLDFVLIFLYFAVLIGMGIYYSRKQGKEDFLIANRKLGTWGTMMTVNASKSGSIFMIFTALVFLWGFSAIWYFIGVVAGAILFIPFALRLRKKSDEKYYTLADYFKYNYGKKPALIISALTILIMFGFLVLNLIAGTKVFIFFTGWPFWIVSSVMAIVILAYLLMAGFKAVAKTDVLQYSAMIAIIVLLALLMFNGSLIPSSEWNLFQADLVTITGFFIVGIMFAFGSPDLWQRVYSSKGHKELRNGLIWSVIFYSLMAFMLSLIALTVKVNFPGVDPDLALIHGFANLLPPGLLGLAVVLLFAAIMSSLDTYLFTAASATVQDFFNWSKEKAVRGIRKSAVILTVLATIIAIIVQDLIIGSYIFIAVLVVISLAVIPTWIKPSIKRRTLLFELVFGIIGLGGFLLFSLYKGQISETIVIFTLGFSILGLIIGGLFSRFKNK